MRIPASKIRNTPKPSLRGDGKAHYRFNVDGSAGTPAVGDVVAWPGGDCVITKIEVKTEHGTWVVAER
ncbi:hypothetical protein [Deinococcus aestuarii]|uniref:hypothetical protein n=1 Tax=Deinococcus aestuarii TaxID=2774531 RepID=UPI001C0D40C6|nr:hypothetical protein [Deinococcus aestuarii]